LTTITIVKSTRANSRLVAGSVC